MALRNGTSERMNEVSKELRGKYESLGLLKAAEATNRADVYRNELGLGNSAAATDKLAMVHVVSYTADIQKMQGEILALEEERDHLRFMVKYNLEGR